jgi:hypothetical protein
MAFGDSDCAMMAHLKIKEVKQGRESMDDYIVCFEEFEGFMGFDNTALIKVFKEGLAPQILSHCSQPGRRNLGCSIITMLSCSSDSSISRASPSSKGDASLNLAHCVKVLVVQQHPPHPQLLPWSKRRPLLAKLAMANVTAVVEKVTGHRIAHRRVLVVGNRREVAKSR